MINRNTTVQRLPVPEGVRALSTLSRLDYADTFVVDVCGEPAGCGPRNGPARSWRTGRPQAPTATGRLVGARLQARRSATPRRCSAGRSCTARRTMCPARGTRLTLRPRRPAVLPARGRTVLRFATFVRHEGRAARLAWAGRRTRPRARSSARSSRTRANACVVDAGSSRRPSRPGRRGPARGAPRPRSRSPARPPPRRSGSSAAEGRSRPPDGIAVAVTVSGTGRLHVEALLVGEEAGMTAARARARRAGRPAPPAEPRSTTP